MLILLLHINLIIKVIKNQFIQDYKNHLNQVIHKSMIKPVDIH